MKHILAIIGSAQPHSSNLKLVQFLAQHFSGALHIEIFDELKSLPHFDVLQATQNVPEAIELIRGKIEAADAVLITSPEYIFNIPAGLKNLLEWCVATTIFTDKPLAVIVASANGKKAFEEIKLIMKTLGACFNDETSLLINGVKAKIPSENSIDSDVQQQLISVIQGLKAIIY
ncbi:MAG TPA: NADPH-dependent FMN reductase [Niabella sp.]|nr:NADPH-dependent FMN reductase [Niabella sp.]